MNAILAQTFTATTQAAPSILDRLDALVLILVGLTAAWQKYRASKATGLLDVVVAGVEAYKATLPKAEAKQVSRTIEGTALSEGVQPALHEVVKRVTEPTRVAYRDDGLPKLALFSALCLGAGGCVSAAIHDSALEAQRSAAMLHRASVPNPGYTTDADRAAWEHLWVSHEAALKAVEEASR